MATRKHNTRSSMGILVSPPFLLLIGAIVMLGGAFLIRTWNENRNDLLRNEISRGKRQQRLLRQEHTDLRVRLARASALPRIEAKIREFGLKLSPPSEAQVMRVIEPDWTAYSARRNRRLTTSPKSAPPHPGARAEGTGHLLAGSDARQTSTSAAP